ncbi:MAG TPA: amino acid ABC transporter permease [Alphaproteobacteria bacterium]|nr:amino acid ABC transporter permease [Alphaproteobacteria bacterium]
MTAPEAELTVWKPAESRPPPRAATGALGWIRENLFSGWLNTLLTIGSVYLLWVAVPPFLDWAIFSATWDGASRQDCDLAAGACWPVILVRWEQLMYGFYPNTEHWRANLAFVLLLVALFYGLYDKAPGRKYGLLFVCAYPFIAYFLLYGGFAGLEYVESAKWGGLLLTLAMGVTGIAFSIPFGIILALGRRSDLPVISLICTVFIEFIRGVPLVTLLFFGNVMLPLFLPEGTNIDNYLRVVIVVCFFASAYMAEVIRGGLQAIPKGQYEAAAALGLGYWKMMGFIILPQALRISIPGIVNTSIGLYKDTTLVSLVGLFDLLGMARAINADTKWMGLEIELYVFIGIVFFITCFAMSRYSLWLEERLTRGERH